MSPEEITYGLQTIIEYALTDADQEVDKPPTWMYPQLVVAIAQRRMAHNRRLEDPDALGTIGDDYLEPVHEMLLALSEELDNTDHAVTLAWGRHQERLHGKPEPGSMAAHNSHRHGSELDEIRQHAESVRLLFQQVLGHYARIVQLAATWEEHPHPNRPLRSPPRSTHRHNVEIELNGRVDDRPLLWRLHKPAPEEPATPAQTE